jgi:4-amino-4-deoxy-L-arabinose transferase-like glycosyltransferase
MLRNKKLITYLLLGLIFIIATFLRLYNLGSYPVGFHQDEASLGYNGYSLMLTGKDDNGNNLPLYIDMFGDNRPSGYHYLTILPIKFFGLNEFATRFPGAVFGSIMVFAVFFFASTIFKDRKLALVSSFLIAVSPWSVILSRASAEAIVSLFFILIGFGLLFGSWKNKRLIYLFFGTVSLILSLFFYHTPRIFVPGLFFVFISIFFSFLNKSSRKYKITFLLSFVLVSAVAVFLVFGVSGGTGRFNQVNIFTSFETNFLQNQQIQEDSSAGSNIIESRIFHNKITNIAFIFVKNYFDYFGFNFLFITGGFPLWYSIPRVGLLYLLELPFVLIGAYSLIKEKSAAFKIIIAWLLVSPMVPSITMDDVPNINRAIVMFPILDIVAGVGFLSFVKNFKYRRIAAFSVGLLLLINIGYFLHQYFYNAKTHKSWYRNNGFAQMMKVVNENYNKADVIVISKYQGGIYPLVLFYSKYNPALYQKEGSPKDKDYSGFGKFFFVPQDCPSTQRTDLPKSITRLFIDKGDCIYNKSLQNKKIKYIDREDGSRAFRIVYENYL